MDIFIEEMVAKKKDGAYFAKVIVLVLVCLSVVLVLVPAGMTFFSAFAPFLFLIAAGCVYGTYYLVTSENVEFEYTLVNSEIDVDKIVNRKKRTKLTCVNLRELDSFGTRQNSDYLKSVKDPAIKKIFACDDKNSEDLFFLVYTENTVKKMLVFSPSDSIVDVITKYNPKKALI